MHLRIAVGVVLRALLLVIGSRCGRVRYLASRPRPFPSNLMMGLLTEAMTEEVTVDTEELVEARWFDRPGPVAPAHQICRRWATGIDSV